MTVNTEQQLGHTVARERDSLQTTYVKFEAHEGGTRPPASFYVAHKTSTHLWFFLKQNFIAQSLY